MSDVTSADTAVDVGSADGGGDEGASIDTGADTGEADADAGACSYVPTPGAIDFRTTDCAPAGAPASERLTCALAQAANDRVFEPPADPSGFGPSEKQGVVRIAFDPSSPPYEGGNAIDLATTAGNGSTFVAMPSDTRLEIDSGVRLVYGDGSVNGQLFQWENVHDVTITRGDPCHERGRFVVDLRSHVALDQKARFVVLYDVDRFLLEHFHTISQYQPPPGQPGGGLGAPTLLFHASPDDLEPPRHGIYRHHSNQGSAKGWGANQVASLSQSLIEDIWTDGGDAVRFETSVGTIGSHDVTVRHVYARNGNVAVALTPHDASSSGIHVSDVHASSMYVGIAAYGMGPPADVGLFTDTTVDDACIVGGTTAQGDVDPSPSYAAVLMRIASGADVTVTHAYRAGDFSMPKPGGESDPSCTAANVDLGFEDWTMSPF